MHSSRNLVVTPFDSPGSSVFDLPTYADAPASRERYGVSSLGLQSTLTPAGGDGPSYIVISGGTGGNAICAAFKQACYVLPVSDDGGSSSEIVRVLGGPSVGDIRSRLVRLIPSGPQPTPLDAIRRLLAYRLPSQSTEREARAEWRDIVEGRSALWSGIPPDRKETIRGFLVHFESEVLKRAHKNFTFRNGSVGNYFLAAAQNFFKSLPSAIFLFSSITSSQANILPVIVTNHTVTIAAELEDGQRLVGQCEISHPVPASDRTKESDSGEDDDATSTDGLAELISPKPNVLFESSEKDHYEPLPSRITRLYYINGYGMEIHPSPNPDFLSNLLSKDILVYSCGSLWTSIMPCLALRGVAKAIAGSSLKAKVLLLNCQNDRETGGYTAVDYVLSIARTLNTNHSKPVYGLGSASTIYPVSAFVTDLVYLAGTRIAVDIKRLTDLGVRCREVAGTTAFTAETVQHVLAQVWQDRK